MDSNVMKRVMEHYKEIKNIYPNVIGIFLQGSQNYNLAYEGSDIDTKAICIPTLEDIVSNRKLISHTHVMANNEHVDVKDIRHMFSMFKKQNINMVEILFTKYYYIESEYQTLLQSLFDNNELIAHYNRRSAVTTMAGMAMEKFHAMERNYDSKINIINKFGYDPKQLSHIIRLEDFITRYINNVPYSQCLIPTNCKELIEVKRGKYSLAEARRIASASNIAIADKRKVFCEKDDILPNPQVETFLQDILITTIKKSLNII